MVSILEDLIVGINETTGLQCYAEMPDGSFQIPMVIITENRNQSSMLSFNGRVEVANLTYQITVYSDNVDDVYNYTELIDNYFKNEVKRFDGSVSSVQQKYPLYYRMLTYSGIVQRKENNYIIL
jgi:hypothetical protein